MANPNPYAARLAQRRAHKPGTLADLLKVLWTAIRDAEHLLYSADDPEFRLRCVHALSQAAGQYAKLLEIGEFEARLVQIEDNQSRRNGA
jgi:hypothetical protein